MVLTGAYHGHAHVIELQRRINTTLSVNFKDKRGKQCGFPRFYKNKRLLGTVPHTELPPSVLAGLANQQAQQRNGGAGASNRDAQMADMTNKASASSGAAERPNMTPSNDFKLKISMGAWHPKDNTFAVAKHNSLFIYTEKRSITTSDKKIAREREREREMKMQQ
mmetsp:Transcript_7287/g.10250  ORF Transcript_7287/g.10250 Transcript_7287/m.10250 type:complete len:165 (-) Transcript_7287:206-700(-)|eukprot:CAMPEP_0185572190 /NCGR_PEP_ID=MMETSP0434-20130131/4155_1 /TAXON_ID=626734 ORGANISM="Favella taraikaensis, Strain Fe Narragansett Bay" /NCGR_SAMPLE_ID=MMETSP0434 /ASSEMBLY_ACC=CAM_ASM_000379 /LENGTH=164 /DNA_ID=CAMNT_0028187951 /DNA_START=1197 /DNA_END=1691 /DNA_ORIENTATION=+